MGSPVYSLPAGNTNIPVLADPTKLPLFIAIDAFIGETSMYADSIFPDQYLERWEFQGSHPNVPHKIQPVRNPAIDPLVPDVTVFGRPTAMSLEALLLGVAERLKLPGFGPGGFGDYGDLSHPDELYLKMVANLASGEKEDGSDSVPDADADELRLFTEARKHIRPSVFDIDRWKTIAGISASFARRESFAPTDAATLCTTSSTRTPSRSWRRSSAAADHRRSTRRRLAPPDGYPSCRCRSARDAIR